MGMPASTADRLRPCLLPPTMSRRLSRQPQQSTRPRPRSTSTRYRVWGLGAVGVVATRKAGIRARGEHRANHPTGSQGKGARIPEAEAEAACSSTHLHHESRATRTNVIASVHQATFGDLSVMGRDRGGSRPRLQDSSGSVNAHSYSRPTHSHTLSPDDRGHVAVLGAHLAHRHIDVRYGDDLQIVDGDISSHIRFRATTRLSHSLA